MQVENLNLVIVRTDRNTQVQYPFEKFGYEDDQVVIDREHWHMVARLTKEEDGSGSWLVSYGEATASCLVSPVKSSLPGNP